MQLQKSETNSSTGHWQRRADVTSSINEMYESVSRLTIKLWDLEVYSDLPLQKNCAMIIFGWINFRHIKASCPLEWKREEQSEALQMLTNRIA